MSRNDAEGVAASQFGQARRIFAEAVAHPAGPKRDEVIRERCGGDERLAALVTRMIEADAAPSLPIDAPLLDLPAAVERARDPSWLPFEAVGQYRLVCALGFGSGGDVYLAHDTGPLARPVAIKVLRHGTLAPSTAGRFRREARALAVLDHPDIARVIEGGTAPDGRPFMAMDYAPGIALDAFIREQDPTAPERIELIRRVAEAVHHAHQRGVLHRDLKPGNILAWRPPDGTDRVELRIIDFGVARLIGDFGGLERTMTHHGAVVGTVGYMAPEQGRGETPTAAVDVYALGVLLRRLVLEQPGAGGVANSAENVSGAREPMFATPRLLSRRLRTDLSAIADMACAADPAQRYASAAHLAEDLRRALADQAVFARSQGIALRSLRTIRRHPRIFAGAAAALLVIGVLVAHSTNQQRRANAVRDAQVSLIRDLLGDELAELSLLGGSGDARENLLKGILEHIDALEAEDDLNDLGMKEARARILQQAGSLAFERRDYESAERYFTEALHLRAAVAAADPDHVERQRSHAFALVHLGNLIEQADLVQALDDRTSLYEVGASQNRMGHADAWNEVKRLYEQAYAIQRSVRERRPDHFDVRNDIVWSRDRLRPYVAATMSPESFESDLRETIRLARELAEEFPEASELHYGVAVAHGRLAEWLYRERQQHAAAEPPLRESIAIIEAILAQEPERVHYRIQHFWTLMGLHNVLVALGRHEEAAEVFVETFRSVNEGLRLAGGAEPRLAELLDLANRQPGALKAAAAAAAGVGTGVGLEVGRSEAGAATAADAPSAGGGLIRANDAVGP